MSALCGSADLSAVVRGGAFTEIPPAAEASFLRRKAVTSHRNPKLRHDQERFVGFEIWVEARDHAEAGSRERDESGGDFG